MRVIVFSVAALLATMLVVCPVATTSADVILSLDTGINGAFPIETDPLKPVLKATFKNDGANRVLLTMDANLYLMTNQYVASLMFNFVGNANNVSIAGALPDSLLSLQTSATKILDGQVGGKQVKAGLFNMLLTFDTDSLGKQFNGIDSLTVPLTGTGITENDFSGLSVDTPGSNPPDGGWYSAALIDGIPSVTNATSGSVGARPPAPAVPEPSTVVLWSLMGVAGIGVGWWRKRSR